MPFRQGIDITAPSCSCFLEAQPLLFDASTNIEIAHILLSANHQILFEYNLMKNKKMVVHHLFVGQMKKADKVERERRISLSLLSI